MLLAPEDNVATLQDFPYHLAEPTKQILLDSVAIFLRNPEFAPFAKNLAALSPGLLLDGPFGTELLQMELIKALAKEHHATLLLLDPTHSVLVPAASDLAGAEFDEGGGGDGAPPPGSMRTRAPSRDALSATATGSVLQSRLALSAASRGKLRLRKGDRVRYVVERPPAEAGVGAPSPHRGPEPGMVGEVVLTFEEDNRSSVGVRFDRAIPGGGSIGGLCEEGHGYFVNVTMLRPESEDLMAHEREGLAIDAMIEVAASHAPCIIVLRDVQALVLASYTRYKHFQRAFSALPPRVIVIGTRAPSSPTG
jgi:hypothetical protein